MEQLITIPSGRNPLVVRAEIDGTLIRAWDNVTGLLLIEVSKERQVGDCMFWYGHQPEVSGIWWARKYCSYSGRSERNFYGRLCCMVIYEMWIKPKIMSGEVFPKNHQPQGCISTFGPGRVKRKIGDTGYTLCSPGGANIAMFDYNGKLERLAKTSNWGSHHHVMTYGDEYGRVVSEVEQAATELFEETYYTEWLRLHVIPTLGETLYAKGLERPFNFQHNRYYSATVVREYNSKHLAVLNAYDNVEDHCEAVGYIHNGELQRYSPHREFIQGANERVLICYPEDRALPPVRYRIKDSDGTYLIEGYDHLKHVMRYHFEEPWVVLSRLDLHKRLSDLKIEIMGDIVNWRLDGQRICTIQFTDNGLL